MDLEIINLRVIMKGEKIKDIARELNLDPRTLRQRLCRWRRKQHSVKKSFLPTEGQFYEYLRIHEDDNEDHKKLARRTIGDGRDKSTVRRVLVILTNMLHEP